MTKTELVHTKTSFMTKNALVHTKTVINHDETIMTRVGLHILYHVILPVQFYVIIGIKFIGMDEDPRNLIVRWICFFCILYQRTHKVLYL